MSTAAAGQSDEVLSRDPRSASRIVRIARLLVPVATGVIVLLVAGVAGPRDAWLPYAVGPATPDAWMREAAWPLDRLASVPIGLARLGHANAVAANAITLASAMAAVATTLLAVSLRTTGLGLASSALLALIAAVAPLGIWQVLSPLGPAPAALLSSLALVLAVRGDATPRTPLSTWRRESVAMLAVGMLVLASGLSWVSRGPEPWPFVHADLGIPGLMLAAVGALGLGRPPVSRVLVGAGAVLLITVGMAPELRAATVLPWLWWLVGAGLTQLQHVRFRQSTTWLLLGLVAWLAIGVARHPWRHQRQQATLVRSWADGLAAASTPEHPWLVDASPTGRLLASRTSHVIARPGRAGDSAIPEEARPATPVLADHLRWQGFGLARVRPAATESLTDLLDALPKATIVVATISASAAATLTPTDWQALGRMGARSIDVGVPRAHAIVGVTGARAEALETAGAGRVDLALPPGTPIGRSAWRSPVDVRVTADEDIAEIALHGRRLVDQAGGLALAFFTTRGDLLAWRAGATAAALTGSPLGAATPPDVALLMRLPCRDLEPGESYRLEQVAPSGALGLTAGRRTSVEIVESRERIELGAATPLGLEVRGERREASIRTDARVAACDAWPVDAVDLSHQPFEQPVTPAADAWYGEGWHATEGISGDYFRWSSGARADWRAALTTSQALSITVDVQGPDSATAGDGLGLEVNGTQVGAVPLPAGRALRTWDVPAALVRRGLNTFTLTTTRTVRPADRPGAADGRVLGVAVRAWHVQRLTERPVAR